MLSTLDVLLSGDIKTLLSGHFQFDCGCVAVKCQYLFSRLFYLTARSLLVYDVSKDLKSGIEDVIRNSLQYVEAIVAIGTLQL